MPCRLDVDSGRPKEPCVRWGAHWRNLANTSEPRRCGFLSNYFDHLLLFPARLCRHASFCSFTVRYCASSSRTSFEEEARYALSTPCNPSCERLCGQLSGINVVTVDAIFDTDQPQRYPVKTSRCQNVPQSKVP